MARASKPGKLTSLSDIFAFFRRNETPITFLSPLAYHVLGLDRWVAGFEQINFFDSFDGTQPRITVPRESGPREFRSIEAVNNYLLRHREVRRKLQERGPGLLLLVAFDEETEELAKGLGQKIALPSGKLRRRLASKMATELGEAVGLASAPHVLGKAKNYPELLKLAGKARLGSDLVVQTTPGSPGRTTFFIGAEPDWARNEAALGAGQIKVMRRVNHLSGSLEAVATRHGTLVGPLHMAIAGIAELTPQAGGWCGNDVPRTSGETARAAREMAETLGYALARRGYKGAFRMDVLIDPDTAEVAFSSIEPRLSTASALTAIVTSLYGGCPILLFHLLEFMEVDWEVDPARVQERWSEFDEWSQIVLKYPLDRIEMITRAPASGVWRMEARGAIKPVQKSGDWSLVAGEAEAFYVRVHAAGDYRYRGADLGVLIARGRFQTDDRRLTDRAKAWIAAIHRQFEAVPVRGSAAPTPPSLESAGKLF